MGCSYQVITITFVLKVSILSTKALTLPGKGLQRTRCCFPNFLFPECWLEYDQKIKQSIIVFTLKGSLLLFWLVYMTGSCLRPGQKRTGNCPQGKRKMSLTDIASANYCSSHLTFWSWHTREIDLFKARKIVEQTYCRMNKKQTLESKKM